MLTKIVVKIPKSTISWWNYEIFERICLLSVFGFLLYRQTLIVWDLWSGYTNRISIDEFSFFSFPGAVFILSCYLLVPLILEFAFTLLRNIPKTRIPGFRGIFASWGWLSCFFLANWAQEYNSNQDLTNWVGFVLLAFGNLFYTWALVSLGFRMSLTPAYSELITHGAYRWMRHPQYFSIILMFFGLCLWYNSWLSWGIFVLFVGLLYTSILYEESYLERANPKYKEYEKNVSRWGLPFYFHIDFEEN